jgi:glycosyltransferase involved in cell wall biosynthesis
VEIALDARLTRQMSVGMQLYVRELVQRLPRVAPDLRFAVVSNAAFDLPFQNARLVRLRDWEAANGGFAEQFLLAQRLAATGAGLIHFMSVYAPRRSALPHLYTIHDLIHLRFPQYFSWKVPPYYRFVVGPAARAAALVITDATATTEDLERLLGVARANIRVVPLAATEDFYLSAGERASRARRVRERFGLRGDFFLYAGNHRPHKNLRVLLEAWQKLPLECDLVITEDRSRDQPLPDGMFAPGRLVRTGHVERSELIDLYAGCTAAIQPSLYEGFGLAVLEAMAVGAPAIVAQTAALLEVGGQAALTFPSADAGALREAMKQILNDADLRERLCRAGQDRAKEFSWDETARRTAALYREALAVRV